MSSIPTIAWVDLPTRRALEHYSQSQNMPLEEVAAELIHDRLKELGVTAPAAPELPERAQAVTSPGLRETLPARRTVESKWRESVKLRNARDKAG
jgi:hypothetical protein